MYASIQLLYTQVSIFYKNLSYIILSFVTKRIFFWNSVNTLFRDIKSAMQKKFLAEISRIKLFINSNKRKYKIAPKNIYIEMPGKT